MTELLSPAGDLTKLEIAWRYGADAAYMGLEGFSLRTRTGSLGKKTAHGVEILRKEFPDKKLYLAANRYLHEEDLRRLPERFGLIASIAPDGLIVSDMGAFRILKSEFPKVHFHLSTQANTINSEAIKLYRDLGFKRVILGRECTFKELEMIRTAVPDVELEVFVHGAMCMAISGRCYLSAWMSGRSANEGDCAHSCRWKFKPHRTESEEHGLISHTPGSTKTAWIEEEQRPGELFPLVEEEGYTSILSSKDLCMIDHVEELRSLGMDSLKIEGRMKSEYYVAMVTRAYRRALDGSAPLSQLKEDLQAFSHREYSTGFFFGREDIEKPALGSYESRDSYLALIAGQAEPDPAWTNSFPSTVWHRYILDVRNSFSTSDGITVVSPEADSELLPGAVLAGNNGSPIPLAKPGQYTELYTHQDLETGHILRRPMSPDS